MNKLLPILFLLSAAVSNAQTSEFSVSYNRMPACYTTFTVTDTTGRILGSGKSDATGTFSCDCRLDDYFFLQARPDKGSKWSLRLNAKALNSTAGKYEIRIEVLEQEFNEAMEKQRKMGEMAQEKNKQMNEESGSNNGVKEIRFMRGIQTAAKYAIKSDFALIKVSVARSCTAVPGNVKAEYTGQAEVKAEVKAEVEAEKQGTDETKASKKAEKEKLAKEKAEKEAEEEAEKAKIKAEKEELKKAKKQAEKEEKEKEEEQKRLEAEKEKAKPKNKIYTPEELEQMSTFDLKSLKMSNKLSAGSRKTDLKLHGSIVKEPKRQEMQAEIDELEKQIEAIKAVLQKRKEKAD